METFSNDDPWVVLPTIRELLALYNYHSMARKALHKHTNRPINAEARLLTSKGICERIKIFRGLSGICRDSYLCPRTALSNRNNSLHTYKKEDLMIVLLLYCTNRVQSKTGKANPRRNFVISMSLAYHETSNQLQACSPCKRCSR